MRLSVLKPGIKNSVTRRQCLDENDIETMVRVLEGDWLTLGPMAENFEKTVAEFCGAKYGVAVSNGTAALHLAAISAGLYPGDEGITTPNTFPASANCLVHCGAIPRFADIQSDTYCIDPLEIEKQITPRTKVIVVVHFAGQPCDMEAIRRIAKDHNLKVIEDAAHAIGSMWRNKAGKWQNVGSCSHSDMTIFSFHPVKTITTGEGGMILTNSPELARRCRLLRNHGITKDPSEFINQELFSWSDSPEPEKIEGDGDGKVDGDGDGNDQPPPWYYEMHELGFNYRLTDFQAALGLTQFKRLPMFANKRREAWRYYNERLSGIEGFFTPAEREGAYSCWHLYVARCLSRDSLLKHLRSKGIGAYAMYIPIHLQPYYQRHFGYKKGDFPKAEYYFEMIRDYKIEDAIRPKGRPRKNPFIFLPPGITLYSTL